MGAGRAQSRLGRSSAGISACAGARAPGSTPQGPTRPAALHRGRVRVLPGGGGGPKAALGPAGGSSARGSSPVGSTVRVRRGREPQTCSIPARLADAEGGGGTVRATQERWARSRAPHLPRGSRCRRCRSSAPRARRVLLRRVPFVS